MAQMQDMDATIGKGLAIAGAGGLTIQWLTDFGSLIAMGINIILGLGGLYLLYLRVKKAHREDREGREPPRS